MGNENKVTSLATDRALEDVGKVSNAAEEAQKIGWEGNDGKT